MPHQGWKKYRRRFRLSPARVRRIERALQRGTMSLRAVARAERVSTSTVHRYEHARRARQQHAAPKRVRQAWRCPGCGHKFVVARCAECNVAAPRAERSDE